MRKNVNQITCVCSAYDFPHRLGGGSCTGDSWCSSYMEITNKDLCYSCNCFNNDNCDVVSGLENVKHAECVIDELRTAYLKDTYGNLPIDYDEYIDKQYNEHYYNQPE